MTDLYRAYGKAAMHAAGMENNLVLALAMKRSEGKSADVFSKEHAKLQRLTLGPLIEQSKASGIFSEASENHLRVVLEYRNWMVHEIARDAIGFIVQKGGGNKLQKTLLEIGELFQGVSELLFNEIINLGEARGIRKEHLHELVELAFAAEIEPNKRFANKGPG
jgi:hypothetical protein